MKVASYYGQVGIQIDRASLRSAQAYFRSVERIIINFQRRVSKNQYVSVRFRIDRSQAQNDIQRAINSISKGISVPIKAFSVKGSSLKRAVENSIPENGRGSVAIGVRISRGSLTTMRDQIRSALEGSVIRPRISPSMRGVSRGSGMSGGSSGGGSRGSGQTMLDPRNTRRMSPWHNPMMVGGGVGAFLRYGMFSLPFVGGVIGLNAYSEAAREFRAQETGLSFAAGLSTAEDRRDVGFHRRYLHQVGERTGMKESLLSRDYHQMLAGSSGTAMEPHLQEGFLGLTQYASILGLTDDSMRLVMRGITQMIGKGKIQAEEARRQVGEQIPTFMRILAEQAAGGDMEKLEEMFDKGILYTEKYLPAVLKEMKRQSDTMMEEYWKSLPYMVNQASRQRDLWLREFTAGGGESGLTAFWNSWIQIQKDSIKFARGLGSLFDEVATEFSAAILLPGELVKWLNGETDKRNFFVNRFGESENVEIVQSLKEEFTTLWSNLKTLYNSLPIRSIDSTLKEMKTILETINMILGAINAPLSFVNSVSQRGVMGHMSYTQDKKSEKEAERLANESPYIKGSPEWENLKRRHYSRLLQEREDSIIPDSWRYQGDIVKGAAGSLWDASTWLGDWMLRNSGFGLVSSVVKKSRESPNKPGISSYFPSEPQYHTMINGLQTPNSRHEFTIDQKVEVVVKGDSDTIIEFLTTEIGNKAEEALTSKLRETNPSYGWSPQ